MKNSKRNSNQTGLNPGTSTLAMKAAFEKHAAAIDAVSDEETVPINVDVHGAVTTVLGALPDVRALAAEISALPNANVPTAQTLEEVALAAAEAQARYVVANTPSADVTTLFEEATRLRETMRIDALALVQRNLLDPARLAGLKGARGYKNVASELLEYATLMDERWPAIEGKSGLTKQEIDHAKQVGTDLLRAVGLREHAPAALTAAAVTRAKAFTLLLRTYDQVRRAVAYLRWDDGDADAIAPSLYAGRKGKRVGTEDDETEDEGEEGGDEGGTAEAGAETETDGNAGADATNGGTAPVGMPGSSPFDS